MFEKILGKNRKFTNLANIITLLRLFLIPIFLYVLIYLNDYFLSFIIFSFASITDKVDGVIARKYDMITDFGKFLDPIVDKMLVISAFVSFIELNIISSIPVLIIIFREISITGFRAIAASNNVVISASNLGKYKTVSQIITILFILILPESIYVNYLVYLVVILTIVSGVDYILKNKNLF